MRRSSFVVTLVASTSLALGQSAAAPPGPDTPAPFVPGLLKKLDAGLRVELASERVSSARIVPVFIKSRDVAATTSAVARLGGRVGTVAKDILTARLAVGALPALGDDVSVVAVEGGRPVKKRLDNARAATGVDRVHEGWDPLPNGMLGSGVIVGIIDDNFDLSHESFRDADGNSRVLGLWDQVLEGGTAPEGYNYGNECSASDIADGNCPQSDPAMHGTHVAGIAAGSQVADSPYTGIAPLADLVFVKYGEAPGHEGPIEGFNVSVCDAVAYIFRVAEELGKPAVINMSLGEHYGPHDGSALADQCLDNLTGPGKILVAAAGNEGAGSWHQTAGEEVRVHASGVATAEPQLVNFLVGSAPSQDIIVWTENDVSLQIQVGFVDDDGNLIASPAFDLTTALESTTLQSGGLVLGPVVGGGGTDDPGGPKGYLVRIGDENDDNLEHGRGWFLAITGDGRFDAFLDTTSAPQESPGGFRVTQAEGITADHQMTIGYPGIAKEVIAVASFVTRNEWTSADGETHQQLEDEAQVALDARSSFSSRGPARNGAKVGLKPDIAAPGEKIIAALHSQVEHEAAEIVVEPPQGYAAIQGTSMASPYIAGVVALLLEANKDLTAEDIRRIFDETAVLGDGQVEADTDWGRGRVDTFAAVAFALTGEVPVADDPVEPGPEEEPDEAPEEQPEEEQPEEDQPDEEQPDEDQPEEDDTAGPGPEPVVETAPEMVADTAPVAETVAEPAAEPAEEDEGGCAGGGAPLGVSALLGLGWLALRARRRERA